MNDGGNGRKSGLKTCMGVFGLLAGVFIMVVTSISRNGFTSNSRPMLRGQNTVHMNLQFDFPTLKAYYLSS